MHKKFAKFDEHNLGTFLHHVTIVLGSFLETFANCFAGCGHMFFRFFSVVVVAIVVFSVLAVIVVALPSHPLPGRRKLTTTFSIKKPKN